MLTASRPIGVPRRGADAAANRRYAGFTLIEILVALFVLALGLLGMAMLQTAGLRFNTNSYSRTQATYFAYDILDRMRANKSALDSYVVDDNADAEAVISTYSSCSVSGGSCNCAEKACSPTELATYELGQWYALQDALLPGAKAAADEDKRATITRNGDIFTITLFWQEQDGLKSQVWHAELAPL